MKRVSFAIWALLVLVALRIAIDGRALLTIHAVISHGPAAIARAVGRYSMLVAPLVLLAWPAIMPSSKKYFRHAL